MLLLSVATLCLVTAACVTALALGVRRRCDLATLTLALSLLGVTAGLKALLLFDAFRPLPVTALAVLAVTVAGGLVCASPVARRRVADHGRLLLVPRRPSWRAWNRRRVAVAVLPLAALAVYVQRAVVAVRLPPMDIDSLWYHLVSVASWVRTGGLGSPIEHLSKAGDLGWTVVSDTYPRDCELVSAWFAVFTHDTSLTGLTQIVFAALLASATYGVCRHLDVRRWLAAWAACAVVLAPAVVNQAAMAYNDIARAAVPVAAWQVLLIAYGRGRDADVPRAVWLCVAGALFGMGMGIKAADAYLIPFGIAAALLLRRSVRPAQGPGVVATVAALAVPAALTGSFWYALTWAKWGSPFWPVRTGPFPGQRTMYDLIDEWRPESWAGQPTAEVTLRSWFAALGQAGTPHWYVYRTGQLGLVWLLALLPAVAVLLWAAAVRRRHVRAAACVVLPLTVATLAAPGAWYSRYTMPLLVSGAVAFAVLAEGAGGAGRVVPAASGRLAAVVRRVPVPSFRPSPRALRTGLAALVCATTAAGVFTCMRYSAFWPAEDPAQRGALRTLAFAARPAASRESAGIWGEFPGVDALPAGTRIGFCAEDPPTGWFPLLLIGTRFERVLVDLGDCRTATRARRLMDTRDVDYVYARGAGWSQIGVDLDAQAGPLGLSRLTVTPTVGWYTPWVMLYGRGTTAPPARP